MYCSTNTYNGYSVNTNHGGLNTKILDRYEQVLATMKQSHNKLSIFRFDLKYPKGYVHKKMIVSKFIDSLKCKIKNDLRKKSNLYKRKVHSEIGYVWVLEKSGMGNWHIHFTLYLNYHVYNCFGKVLSPKSNMYKRIEASWASALSVPLIFASGLVHLPDNSIQKVDFNSKELLNQIDDLLKRLSYFAKFKTKPYGKINKKSTYQRFFGSSQVKVKKREYVEFDT